MQPFEFGSGQSLTFSSFQLVSLHCFVFERGHWPKAKGNKTKANGAVLFTGKKVFRSWSTIRQALSLELKRDSLWLIMVG